MMRPSEFDAAVRQYRFRFAASVTSAGRTVEHNTAVGGVARSAHLFDVGADLVYDAMPALGECLAVGERLGLRVIREGDHDHLQPLDWPKG